MEAQITLRARGLRRNALIAALVALAGTVITFLVALPSAYARTIADYPPPPPAQSGSGGSTTDPGTATSGGGSLVTKALASTGSNVALFLVVAAVLIVLGVTALYLARRRSA